MKQEEFDSSRQVNFIFIFLLAVCVFFMTTRLGSHIQTIKNLLYYVLFPTQETSEKIFRSTQKISNNVKDIVHAHQENLILHKQLEKYIQLENEWLVEKDENARMRSLLGFEMPKKRKMLAARIVSREPGSWFQWVIIDKGKNDGVFIDAPVLVIRDSALCVLGRVGEAFQNSSKVVLLTNALFAMPAMLGSTSEDGLLEGQNGPLLKMNYLISKNSIKKGEEVVTSPLSSVMPEKIVIGVIKELAASENETFSSALVEPRVNLSNLREVVILVTDKEAAAQKKADINK